MVSHEETRLPVPLLWARERIRELEEGHDSGAGSRQEARKPGKRGKSIIELSKKYGVISSMTSFIGIEKRADGEKGVSEIVLRKVPSLITKGWHGGLSRVGMSPTIASVPAAAMSYCITRNKDNSKFQVSEMQSRGETLYSIRMETTKKPDKKDILFEILNSQKPTGGLELSMILMTKLGITKGSLAKEEENVAAPAGTDIRLLL